MNCSIQKTHNRFFLAINSFFVCIYGNKQGLCASAGAGASAGTGADADARC